MAGGTTYVLGSSDPEIARLDAQAASIAMPTAMLLRTAGIRPGMRVLDLGTGPGHVAFELAELVGPTGFVVGLDRDPRMIGVAEERRAARGIEHMAFTAGDARGFSGDQPFDAVVARLLLFHLPDAVDVLRRHAEALTPGGLAVAIDYDVGAARSEPPCELPDRAIDWVMRAFRSAAADPVIGSRLGILLAEAGLADVTSLGLQIYFRPDDPTGPMLLASVVRSLAPQIVAAGIATEEEIGLDTLEQRLGEELRRRDAAFLPPTVVGAWGRRSA